MNNEILHLFRKYINNQCSPEELEHVLNLIANNEYQVEFNFILDNEEDEVITGELSEEIKSQKFKRLHDRILHTVGESSNHIIDLNSRKALWRRIAVAVIILITLSTAAYFYPAKIKQLESAEVKYETDIAPGGNKAILTLADGRQIVLNDAKNGEIVDLSGIKITKTADGQIIYTITGLAATTSATAYNTIETPKGGQYQVQLPDGTKVWLNASSSLKFPASFASLSERKVELNGEAYFEVAHNRAVPFKVATNNQVVEVLGTHFNINAYKDEEDVKTTLLEGSVKVEQSSTKNSRILKPGQQASLSSDNLKVEDIDTEMAVAWKNDLFMFEHDSIQRIMRMVERWYDVDVQYIGNIPSDRFGGAVSKFENVSEVLKTLELTGKVHFKIEGRRIIVTK